MAYNDTIAADSPRAYFRFEDNTTNSGATGTVSGSPAGYVNGIGGKAAEFNGHTVYASSGTSGTFGNQSGGITMEAWVKTTGTAARTIVRVGSSESITSYTYRLRMLNDGRVQMAFRTTGATDQTANSTLTINDGEWHHVVGVGQSTSLAVFVDGEKKSGSATNYGGNITSPKFYVGSSGDAEFFDGVIDEAAVYNKVLADARVTAHYNDGLAELPSNAVSVEVDLDLPTLSLSSLDLGWVGTVFGTTVNLDTARLSLSTSDVEVEAGELRTLTASNPSAYPATVESTNLTFPWDIAPGATINSVTLRLPVSDRSAGVDEVQIRRVLSDGGNTLANRKYASVYTNGVKTVDVTEMVSDALISGGFYGLHLSVAGPGSTNTVTLGSAPTLVVTYLPAPPVSVGVDLDSPAVSLSAKDVSTHVNTTVVLDTPSAAMYAPEGDVEAFVNPDAIVDLEAAAMAFSAPEAEAYTPVHVALDLDLADGFTLDSNDAEVLVKYNAINELDTPKIWVYRRELESVNGEPIVAQEEDDPYFNVVMVDNPTYWYRFNDQTNPAKDRMQSGATNSSATVHNGIFGLNDGPNDRRYVRFNGTAMMEQPGEPFWSDFDESIDRNGTLEFSLRTAKRNQFVMRGDDLRSGVLSGSDSPPIDIYIKDGKIELRKWDSRDKRWDIVFTGFTDIADNDWHHVILTYEEDRPLDRYSTGRVNLYIDGELDVRRYTTAEMGFPDYIGGRPSYPTSLYPSYFELPQTSWFVGDLAEIVYYRNSYFNQDKVYRHTDMLFGRDPIYVDSARVNLSVKEPVVKGNKPRVLVLDFNIGAGAFGTYTKSIPHLENDGFVRERSTDGDRQLSVGFDFSGYGKWIPTRDGADKQMLGPTKAWDKDGMLFYNVSVLPDTNYGMNWTDERLDVQRLIDLEKDINMDDYDVISIVDYPQSSNDMANYDFYEYGTEFGGMPIRQQLENLMEQIRKQVVGGKGLFINDPASAIALGIIDRVEYVPAYREGLWLDDRFGAITGLYDAFYKGKVKPADPSVTTSSRYVDQHANMFQRVVNEVEGLTDLKGFHIMSDAFYWAAVDPFADPSTKFGWKLEDRTETGLILGDEFYLLGNNSVDSQTLRWTQAGSGLPRDQGWLGVPLSSIKAGVAVTTFGNKIGLQDKMVDNPFKNHAVSIAVRPGDSIKGEVIAGKVYVNFTEAWTNWASDLDVKKKEILPADGYNPKTKAFIPEDDRYWSYAELGSRGTWDGGESIVIGGGGTSFYQTPSGEWKFDKNKDAMVFSVSTYKSDFPVEEAVIAPMAFRALAWMVRDVETDGNVTVGVQTPEVTLGAKDVTVETTKSVTVDLPAPQILTNTNPLRDVTEADVTVLLPAPSLKLEVAPFIETVNLDAPSITLEARDVVSDLLNNVDRIWVTMPVHEITLILEEE